MIEHSKTMNSNNPLVRKWYHRAYYEKENAAILGAQLDIAKKKIKELEELLNLQDVE